MVKISDIIRKMGASDLHTVVLSDLHLADAELGEPGKSLWKRYKRPKFFIDRAFRKMLQLVQKEVGTQKAELILNGDIFDFDSVTKLPLMPAFKVNKLEELRGLFPEEEKSRFKIETILSDHAVWVQALRDWLKQGNSIVFIIGNHDVELNWPEVQKEILRALQIDLTLAPEEIIKKVRFCEWFYISNQDTVIEHGNQYDDYCVNINPIHPFIKKGKRVQVRLPFGNVSSRMMINGMGLFNPHVESTFLMSLREYLHFFYRYALRVQPLLLFTWLWSAAITFFVALGDGLLPAMKDPLFTEQRVEEIAHKSNATPNMVRTLRELHTHSAIFNPLKIARELWLDRLAVAAGIVLLSFQVFAFIYIWFPISLAWWVASLFLLIPAMNYYARNIKSEVMAAQEEAMMQAPLIAKISKVNRVIFGHTHRELHAFLEGVEVLNTGTWSPAFKNPECTEAYGKKCIAWIKPSETNSETAQRFSCLYEWEEAVESLKQLNVEKVK